MNCGCGNQIPVERASLGYKTCITCSQAAYKGRPRGVLCWDHKTAPTLQVLSPDTWKTQRKYYVPNGARSAVKNFSKNSCA